VTKQFAAGSNDREKALSDAITYCIEHHILEDFLKKYRQEVLGMILEEFDVDKYERSLKQEGEERINALNQRLIADNRTQDLLRATQDKVYQEQLLKEYHL
jgi:hypothetical protein